jgi:hypothetical protein
MDTELLLQLFSNRHNFLQLFLWYKLSNAKAINQSVNILIKIKYNLFVIIQKDRII